MIKWIHGVLDDAMLPFLKAISPGYRQRMAPFRGCEPCRIETLQDAAVASDVELTDCGAWRGYQVQKFRFANAVDICPAGDNQVSGCLLNAVEGRPWTLIVPGYGTGALPRSGYSLFQTLHGRLLLERGINVALIDLPGHLGRRRPGYRSGEAFFSPDLASTKANILQGAADVIATFRWLAARSARRVGLWGTSLGGCVAGLAATRLDQAGAVVLMEPLDNPGDALALLAGAQEIRDELRRHGVPPEQLPDLMRDVAPSSYRPAAPPESLLIIVPEWDRVVPARFQHSLWEAWGSPRRLTYRTGHIGLHRDPRPAQEAADFIAARLLVPIH